MPQLQVNFTFHSGVKRHLFSNLRLSGSWECRRTIFPSMD
jgi:hypothetical protein